MYRKKEMNVNQQFFKELGTLFSFFSYHGMVNFVKLFK